MKKNIGKMSQIDSIERQFMIEYMLYRIEKSEAEGNCVKKREFNQILDGFKTSMEEFHPIYTEARELHSKGQRGIRDFDDLVKKHLDALRLIDALRTLKLSDLYLEFPDPIENAIVEVLHRKGTTESRPVDLWQGPYRIEHMLGDVFKFKQVAAALKRLWKRNVLVRRTSIKRSGSFLYAISDEFLKNIDYSNEN